jgi:rubredoxin
MNQDLSLNSGFARWRMRQPWPANMDEEVAQKEEALIELVASFRRGEITSLDGVDSVTSKAIMAIHGQHSFEMNSHWILSAQDWVCPCCRRGKVAISRKGAKDQILAKLVIHHDHMGEVIQEEFCSAFVGKGTAEPQVEGKRLVERIGNAFAAYESILICEDCNNADSKVKRELGLPKYFSFSIGQMARFLSPAPHVSHQYDLDVARSVWEEAEPAYELRMRLVREVATAAATNAHWYEPHDRYAIPIPVYGYADWRLDFPKLTSWVGLFALTKALGPQERIHAPNRTRWRIEQAKAGKPLPENYLAMLRSADHMAEDWNALPDDWRCIGCDRSKHDQVYVGAKGAIQFRVPGTSKDRRWRQQRVCNHCHSVVMSMKEEVTERAGVRPTDSWGYFSPEELKKIIQPRPHSPHLIKTKDAEALVELAVIRVGNRTTYEEE